MSEAAWGERWLLPISLTVLGMAWWTDTVTALAADELGRPGSVLLTGLVGTAAVTGGVSGWCAARPAVARRRASQALQWLSRALWILLCVATGLVMVAEPQGWTDLFFSLPSTPGWARVVGLVLVALVVVPTLMVLGGGIKRGVQRKSDTAG